jgi:polyhydroxyalkanoate synthesis regulator phasin
MAMFDIIRNALLAGYGVQEKVREFVDELVKKGELSESQGAKLVKDWAEKAEKNTEDVSNSINDLLKKALDRMKFPSKDDIDSLNEKVNALSARLKKLEGENEEGR